jgi:hypothetical protein
MPNTTPLPVPSQALYQSIDALPPPWLWCRISRPGYIFRVSVGVKFVLSLQPLAHCTHHRGIALRRVIILAVRDGEYRGHRGRLGGDAEDPLLLCQLIN